MRPTTPDIDANSGIPPTASKTFSYSEKKKTHQENTSAPNFSRKKTLRTSPQSRAREQKAARISSENQFQERRHDTKGENPNRKVNTIHLLDMALKRRGMLLHSTGLMSFHKPTNGEDASSHPWSRNQCTTTNRHPGLPTSSTQTRQYGILLIKKCQLQAKSSHQDKSMDAHITSTHRSHKINAMIGNPSPRSPQAQDTKHSNA